MSSHTSYSRRSYSSSDRSERRRKYGDSENEHKIDKKKLLEIAQRNVAQMAQVILRFWFVLFTYELHLMHSYGENIISFGFFKSKLLLLVRYFAEFFKWGKNANKTRCTVSWSTCWYGLLVYFFILDAFYSLINQM